MTNLDKHDRSRAAILGLGTSVPKYSVDNHVSAQFAAHSLCVGDSHTRKIKVLYRRSGIQRRGSVLLEEEPASDVVEHEFYPPARTDVDRGPSTKQRNDRFAIEAPALAEEAGRRALAESGTPPGEITHLVTVTCTGFIAPGIDIALIDRLGLPATTQRIQVGFMGCHAAINGLRAASGLAGVDDEARILVVCVELCSLHLQYGMNADAMVSNALFADGAGAMVVGQPRDGNVARGTIAGTGSYLVGNSTDAMTWRVGDNGFEMTLSAEVPELIERHLASFVVPWIAGHGESLDSIGGWAVHPGGPRILSSVQAGLNLPNDALEVPRHVLSSRGNMSSATMMFILQEFENRRQPKPWLMLGFGPGLEIEVALLR